MASLCLSLAARLHAGVELAGGEHLVDVMFRLLSFAGSEASSREKYADA
jgi:hypothetical protein